MLKVFSYTKILSHPHLIALDNQEAVFELGEYRRVPGEISQSDNNSNYRKQPPLTANTTIKITPRIGRAMINSAETSITPMVNLTVEINIDEFKSSIPGQNDRITRKVKTVCNVPDNAILALGGLAKSNSDQGSSKTPILGDIPIIGWFFKKQSSSGRQTCLTVFIRPTIIDPRRRERMNEATQDYLSAARHHIEAGGLFDNLRDPITKWFFSKGEAAKQLDTFVAKDQRKNDSYNPVQDDLELQPIPGDPDWDVIKRKLSYENNPLA